MNTIHEPAEQDFHSERLEREFHDKAVKPTQAELHTEYLRCVAVRKAKELIYPPVDMDDDS